MNTTTPQYTPETGEGSPSLANFTIQKLERELNEARDQLNAMREAIREAGHILGYYRKFTPALVDLPEDIWLETVEGKQVLSALTKLQPFIKP